MWTSDIDKEIYELCELMPADKKGVMLTKLKNLKIQIIKKTLNQVNGSFDMLQEHIIRNAQISQ